MQLLDSITNKEYKIVIKKTRTNAGKYTIKGFVLNDKTGKQVKGTVVIRTANSKHSCQNVETAVIEKCESMVPKCKNRKNLLMQNNEIDENSTIVKACRKAFEDGIIGENHIWKPSTTSNVKSRFFKVFIPEVQLYEGAESVPKEIIQRIKDILVDDYINSGHTLKDKANAESNADKTMGQFQKVWETALNYIEYSDMMPNITFPARPKRPRKKREQIKMLPLKVFADFLKKSIELIDENPLMALPVWVIVVAGCRVSEAVAITPTKITDNGKFLVIEVSQQEYKGSIVQWPKTDYSNRRIPVVEFGAAVIRKCLKEIKDRGIELVDDKPICKSRKVSLWIKDALIESGLSREDFNHVEIEIRLNPEHDYFKLADLCTGAHIMRRNIASIWKNYCGCSCKEIDFLLGHNRPMYGIGSFQVNDARALFLLAQKLYRFDYEALICGKTPSGIPIDIGDNETTDIPLYAKICVNNNKVKKTRIIKIVAKNAEPGEIIKITTPEKAKVINLELNDMGNNNNCRLYTEAINMPETIGIGEENEDQDRVY